MKKILFLSIIIIASCVKDKRTELSYLLTNGGCKYWDMVNNPRFYNKSKSRTFPYYCYSFDKNKKWQFFSYKKGIRKPYDQGDIAIPESWSLISDTSILIGNSVFKIETLTKDTFVFTSRKAETTVLARSLIK